MCSYSYSVQEAMASPSSPCFPTLFGLIRFGRDPNPEVTAALTANRGRRRLQFRLRTLLLAVLLVALALSAVATKVRRAEKQTVAVRMVEKLGGKVLYDYQQQWRPQVKSIDEWMELEPEPMPSWLSSFVGVDLIHDVLEIDLRGTGATEEDKARLEAALPSCKIWR